VIDKKMLTMNTIHGKYGDEGTVTEAGEWGREGQNGEDFRAEEE